MHPASDHPALPARRPLVDLHRHLAGSLRASTVVEIAHREGHPLSSALAPRALLVAEDRMAGLLAYLERVDIAAEPLVRVDDWVRAAREVVLDAYDEGLELLELRFSQVEVAPPAIGGRIALASVLTLSLLVTGVTVALEAGGGLYWLPVAVIVAIIVAAVKAWVLLVEVLR